jgi:membrane fusion protein, heavy metal efflux system
MITMCISPLVPCKIVIAALGLFSLLALGCNHEKPKPAAAAVSTKPSDPMEIVPPLSLLERIRVGEPVMATVGADVTVAARIDVDETRVTRVGSPVMGRVVELAAREGQEVVPGQLLAVVNSTGLSDAQLDFLKAYSQRQLAQRGVERAQLLLKADVIGVAELQRREAELAQAGAALDAARDQLALLGMPDEAIAHLQKTRNINSFSRVVASMAGTVLDRKITLGQVVQPADTAYEIAELSGVWLVADVPERNAGNLAVGQHVEATVAALPGRTIHGTLSFVSATVNPETHTVRVRMDLPNTDRKLKPAMLATMIIKDQTEQRLVVPTKAIVREGGIDHVFIQRDDTTFVLQRVTLGAEFGATRVVIDGVKADDKIVVSGAFHLNNERRLRSTRSAEGA